MILNLSFLTSQISQSSATKKSDFANYKIGDTIYNLVDTPGIFDTDVLVEDTLEEIARTIQKCAYGIKAIIFVFGELEYWS